jgi:hypothetical protein
VNRNKAGTEQEQNRNGTGTEQERNRNRTGTEQSRNRNGTGTEQIGVFRSIYPQPWINNLMNVKKKLLKLSFTSIGVWCTQLFIFVRYDICLVKLMFFFFKRKSQLRILFFFFFFKPTSKATIVY